MSWNSYKNVVGTPQVNVTNNTTRNGLGFVGALTIVFIVLKLIGVITWSWWWVLAPIWISAALWIGVIALFAVIVGIAVLLDRR